MSSQRIVIAGSPRCGKTTRAAQLARETNAKVLHTDDEIGRGWSEASAAVAEQLGKPGPWIVEGVAAGRALRKWLAANRVGKPCDVVIYMRRPFVGLTDGQRAMAKGCETVWSEISAQLVKRGVRIQSR